MMYKMIKVLGTGPEAWDKIANNFSVIQKVVLITLSLCRRHNTSKTYHRPHILNNVLVKSTLSKSLGVGVGSE